MALIRNNGDIDQRERERKWKGRQQQQCQEGININKGPQLNEDNGWIGDGMGMGATWGVIGKLGGRADSPHYWGWIAFAGRSTVIRVSFSILDININLNISINKSTIKAKDIQWMNQLYSIWIFWVMNLSSVASNSQSLTDKQRLPDL